MKSNKMMAEVEEVLSQLAPSEQRILRLLFGIGSRRVGRDELERNLRVSREWLRQTEARAVRRLWSTSVDPGARP